MSKQLKLIGLLIAGCIVLLLVGMPKKFVSSSAIKSAAIKTSNEIATDGRAGSVFKISFPGKKPDLSKVVFAIEGVEVRTDYVNDNNGKVSFLNSKPVFIKTQTDGSHIFASRNVYADKGKKYQRIYAIYPNRFEVIEFKNIKNGTPIFYVPKNFIYSAKLHKKVHLFKINPEDSANFVKNNFSSVDKTPVVELLKLETVSAKIDATFRLPKTLDQNISITAGIAPEAVKTQFNIKNLAKIRWLSNHSTNIPVSSVVGQQFCSMNGKACGYDYRASGVTCNKVEDCEKVAVCVRRTAAAVGEAFVCQEVFKSKKVATDVICDLDKVGNFCPSVYVCGDAGDCIPIPSSTYKNQVRCTQDNKDQVCRASTSPVPPGVIPPIKVTPGVTPQVSQPPIQISPPPSSPSGTFCNSKGQCVPGISGVPCDVKKLKHCDLVGVCTRKKASLVGTGAFSCTQMYRAEEKEDDVECDNIGQDCAQRKVCTGNLQCDPVLGGTYKLGEIPCEDNLACKSGDITPPSSPGVIPPPPPVSGTFCNDKEQCVAGIAGVNGLSKVACNSARSKDCKKVGVCDLKALVAGSQGAYQCIQKYLVQEKEDDVQCDVIGQDCPQRKVCTGPQECTAILGATYKPNEIRCLNNLACSNVNSSPSPTPTASATATPTVTATATPTVTATPEPSLVASSSPSVEPSIVEISPSPSSSPEISGTESPSEIASPSASLS